MRNLRKEMLKDQNLDQKRSLNLLEPKILSTGAAFDEHIQYGDGTLPYIF